MLNVTATWNAAGQSGGFLYSGAAASFEMTDSVIENNSAGQHGGAIAAVGPTPSITLQTSIPLGTLTRSNTAAGRGGIEQVEIHFKNNTAVGRGGAFYYSGSSFMESGAAEITLQSLSIDSNMGSLGGGVFVNGAAVASIDNLFTSNTATGGKGGGMYLSSLYEGWSVSGGSVMANSGYTFGSTIFLIAS